MGLPVNTPPMFAKYVSVAVYTCKEGSAPPFGLLSGSLRQHSSIVMLLCESVGEANALIGERKRAFKERVLLFFYLMTQYRESSFPLLSDEAVVGSVCYWFTRHVG